MYIQKKLFYILTIFNYNYTLNLQQIHTLHDSIHI